MSRALLPSLLAAALSIPLSAAAAGGDPGCGAEGNPGLIVGPVATGFFDADFATGRRACPRTEVGLNLQGGAAIDVADFYGHLGGQAVLFGSYALRDDLELFGALEAVRAQYLVNASLSGLWFTLGQATVGATWSAYRQGPLVVSPTARVMLPTSSALPNVRLVGAELGVAARYRALPQLDVHGSLAGDLSAGLSAGPALPRVGLLASVGAQYVLLSWLSVALDVNAHAGPYAYLAPALGIRATVGKALGLELGGTLPLVGTLRHNAAGGLKVSYRFGGE